MSHLDSRGLRTRRGGEREVEVKAHEGPAVELPVSLGCGAPAAAGHKAGPRITSGAATGHVGGPRTHLVPVAA